MSAAQLRDAVLVALPAARITIFENQAPFLDYVARADPARELVIFAKGQATWAVVLLLRLCAAAALPVRHAGDLDRSGVLILRSLARHARVAIEPWRMDVATHRRFASAGRPLDADERVRLASLVTVTIRPRPAMRCSTILRTGTWIEQEVFSHLVLISPPMETRPAHRARRTRTTLASQSDRQSQSCGACQSIRAKGARPAQHACQRRPRAVGGGRGAGQGRELVLLDLLVFISDGAARNSPRQARQVRVDEEEAAHGLLGQPRRNVRVVAEQEAHLVDGALLRDPADQPRRDVVARAVVGIAGVLGGQEHAEAAGSGPAQQLEHRLLGRRRCDRGDVAVGLVEERDRAQHRVRMPAYRAGQLDQQPRHEELERANVGQGERADDGQPAAAIGGRGQHPRDIERLAGT